MEQQQGGAASGEEPEGAQGAEPPQHAPDDGPPSEGLGEDSASDAAPVSASSPAENPAGAPLGEDPPDEEPDRALAVQELLDKHSLLAPGILMDFMPGRDSPLKGRLVLPAGELTPAQRLALLQDFARLVGWADAGQARAVADVYRDFTVQREPGLSGRTERIGAAEARSMAVVETSAALSLTDGQAQRVVARSLRLAGPFAAVLDAQEEGHIGPRQADVIVDQAEGVPPDSIEDYARRCLESARDRAGRLRTSVEVRRSAKGFRERAHPESAIVRKQRAVLERRVELRPEEDGMSTVSILLPEEVGLAVYTRIDREARVLSKEAGETRTLAQLRADVCAAAILDARSDGPMLDMDSEGGTRTPANRRSRRRRSRPRSRGGVRADITVTVPLPTLLGTTDDGAVLGGMGALDAATARELAAAAPTWWVAFTDAEGTVVGMGRRRYRPPAALAAFVRARDVTCRWLGCSVPALDCEIDHLHEWAKGGATDPDNLVCLCRRHHRLKTLGLIDASADTLGGLAPGRIALSTPSGQTLTGHPVQHELPPPASLQGESHAGPDAPDVDGTPEGWTASGFATADEAHLTDALPDDPDGWPGRTGWGRPTDAEAWDALAAGLKARRPQTYVTPSDIPPGPPAQPASDPAEPPF